MPTKTLHTLWQTMKAAQTSPRLDPQALVETTLARHGLAAPAGLVPDTGSFGRHAPHAPMGKAQKRQRFTCASGARDYVVHAPDAATPPRGLVLMLHGCTQTPEDFATGTGLDALAQAAGLVVVWPAQSRGDNAQSCWNWFSGADQHHGRGEPAILAGLTRQVADQYAVPDDAIFAAGLSAGAAMAVILGRTYPEVFAAVGAHAGLPYGCARGVNEAFAAMAGQGDRFPDGSTGNPDQSVRTIVFHGSADKTVAPTNGMQIYGAALPKAGSVTEVLDEGTANGRGYRRTTALGPEGQGLAEHWLIDGLAHAWSGGNPKGSHTDATGPDASAEMLRFFMAQRDKGGVT